jgi:exodeoxyribonuclease-5
VRDVVEKLQTLRRRANSTTPHDLLSQAVDLLRLRPILVRRHRGQAERALSNVDLYLSLAQAYSVRGLRAFSEAMTAAWNDEAKEVEGRPDAQEEAVALGTVHIPHFHRSREVESGLV